MKSRVRWVIYGILGLIIVPAIGLAAWVWITLNYSYSSGERAGQLQKISRRGWVCKTWEGEFTMPTQPGIAPQVFNFSIRDEAVAQQLMKAAGQRVSLSYEQHMGVPTKCFGETEYYITRVQVLGN